MKEVDVKQWGHNKVELYMKRQEATESSPSSNTHNLVVDDPEIVQQFHNSLATLESVLSNTCLEQFPCIGTDLTGLCCRCHLDTEMPYLPFEKLHVRSLLACFNG